MRSASAWWCGSSRGSCRRNGLWSGRGGGRDGRPLAGGGGRVHATLRAARGLFFECDQLRRGGAVPPGVRAVGTDWGGAGGAPATAGPTSDGGPFPPCQRTSPSRPADGARLSLSPGECQRITSTLGARVQGTDRKSVV